MKKRFTHVLPALLLSGVFTFWGCEKVAQTDLSPKPGQSNQEQVASPPTVSPSSYPAAWQRFVDRVERGELVDPSGQYVAKGTKSKVDAAGHRISRPKFDAATSAFTEHYARLKNGEVVGITPGEAVSNYIQPCGEDCGGGGGPTSTFYSSEGVAPYSGADNPLGYVWDLKIGYGSSPGARFGIPNSYTVLNSDLNQGAGGDYIYIGFTRVPGNVAESPEVIFGQRDAVGPVTTLGIGKKYSYFDDYPPILPPFYPVWVDTGRRLQFEQHDLNEGAGGTYIHAYQSKYAGNGAPIEVGVLSGTSSFIEPPSGWVKASSDLNESAGGNFIYFCIKTR
jgi:hypothetical protein